MSAADDELVASAKARIGTILKGKYRLDALLGAGGMGAVYRATNQVVGREVAIKLLHGELSSRADVLKRFTREALAANAVNHPGVVAVLDHDVDDGSAFLVMELLEGESLERRSERAGGKLSVAEVVALMLQLLDVLVAAHAKGVIHRDLKPENLFIGNDGRLRVLDFGIARQRALVERTLTRTGEIFGTPSYMSPEQAMGETRLVDASSDVWSTGAVAFALLSGRCVHEAPNVPQILVAAATRPAPTLASVAPQVPPSVGPVFDRALAFRKGDRWPSAETMREALARAQDEAIRTSLHDESDWADQATRLSAPPEVAVLRALRAAGAEAMETTLPMPTLPRPRDRAARLLGAARLRGRILLARMRVQLLHLKFPASSGVRRSDSTVRHRWKLGAAAIGGLVVAFILGSLAVALLHHGKTPAAARSSASDSVPSAAP